MSTKALKAFLAEFNQQNSETAVDMHFSQDTIRAIRNVLVNANEDIPHEEFLLNLISARTPTVSIRIDYATHLKEYLQGVLK